MGILGREGKLGSKIQELLCNSKKETQDYEGNDFDIYEQGRNLPRLKVKEIIGEQPRENVWKSTEKLPYYQRERNRIYA